MRYFLFYILSLTLTAQILPETPPHRDHDGACPVVKMTHIGSVIILLREDSGAAIRDSLSLPTIDNATLAGIPQDEEMPSRIEQRFADLGIRFVRDAQICTSLNSKSSAASLSTDTSQMEKFYLEWEDNYLVLYRWAGGYGVPRPKSPVLLFDQNFELLKALEK